MSSGMAQQIPEEREEDAPVTLSKDAQARIEVALYASGRPLSLDEISKVAKVVSKKRLNDLMRDLARRINSTFVGYRAQGNRGTDVFSSVKAQLQRRRKEVCD